MIDAFFIIGKENMGIIIVSFGGHRETMTF
jgi:hypothetical protein